MTYKVFILAYEVCIQKICAIAIDCDVLYSGKTIEFLHTVLIAPLYCKGVRVSAPSGIILCCFFIARLSARSTCGDAVVVVRITTVLIVGFLIRRLRVCVFVIGRLWLRVDVG